MLLQNLHIRNRSKCILWSANPLVCINYSTLISGFLVEVWFLLATPRSSASFWSIFLFWQRERLLRYKNLVHQLLDAWKSVIFNSSAFASAFDRIMLRDTMYPLCLWSSIQWMSLSSSCGHWHCFPRVLHLFSGIHISFSTFFRQSRTNFSLTSNSRLAAQLLESLANLTTCSLNFAVYLIRFDTEGILENTWYDVTVM